MGVELEMNVTETDESETTEKMFEFGTLFSFPPLPTPDPGIPDCDDVDESYDGKCEA